MKSVFISSTFRDMHAERDALAQIVLPDLAAEAAKHQEDIDFIDLRWGVDTTELESEEGARKVLSVCLDEIEHARPYMIVLLGERYGWVPDQALIRQAAAEKEYDTEDDFKSVTALEIEFGALISVTEEAIDTIRTKMDKYAWLCKLYAWHEVQKDEEALAVYREKEDLRNEIASRTGDKRFSGFLTDLGLRVPKRKKARWNKRR